MYYFHSSGIKFQILGRLGSVYICVCLNVQRSSAYKWTWQRSGSPLYCVCVSVVSFLFCFLKHHSTQYVRKISKVRCLRAWPTYHKAELRWGRAFIALCMWILCACTNRLDERKLRWADVYPSEVVFCLVRFSVEVL